MNRPMLWLALGLVPLLTPGGASAQRAGMGGGGGRCPFNMQAQMQMQMQMQQQMQRQMQQQQQQQMQRQMMQRQMQMQQRATAQNVRPNAPMMQRNVGTQQRTMTVAQRQTIATTNLRSTAQTQRSVTNTLVRPPVAVRVGTGPGVRVAPTPIRRTTVSTAARLNTTDRKSVV